MELSFACQHPYRLSGSDLDEWLRPSSEEIVAESPHIVKAQEMSDTNRERYNQIWQRMDVQRPEIWSTWEVVKDFKDGRILEIGPGNYPKIPIEGGAFIDISEEAVRNLEKAGGKALVGSAENLPFGNDSFDLVVATDVLEHIEDDRQVLSEVSRVLKPKGYFLFSVPLRPELFNKMDAVAGHKRRYEIGGLLNLLSSKGFEVARYRSLSFYFEVLRFWGKLLGLTKLMQRLYGRKEHAKFFGLPRPIVNLLSRAYAFLDRLRCPHWRDDVETLAGYRGEWVMLLCRKQESHEN